MTDRDPAFLWETEALRSATHRIVEAEADSDISPDGDGRWVTLREANRATGIPVETLRKWARRSTVPTYLVPTNRGTSVRMVDLDGVRQRAEDLGRSTTMAPAAEPSASFEPLQDAPAAGTMIVPVDAWNKMLAQLGNLHDAGQQLAEARERAGKAETEARFLRERLAELRSTDSTQPTTVSPPTPPPTIEPEATQAATQAPEKVWHYLVRRMRDRNQG